MSEVEIRRRAERVYRLLVGDVQKPDYEMAVRVLSIVLGNLPEEMFQFEVEYYEVEG